jgi:hypothetical protein
MLIPTSFARLGQLRVEALFGFDGVGWHALTFWDVVRGRAPIWSGANVAPRCPPRHARMWSIEDAGRSDAVACDKQPRCVNEEVRARDAER